MISHGSHERSVTPAAAVEILKQHARREGLELTLTSVGAGIRTWTCRLSDAHGRSAVGRGKGIGPQGAASAISECLEHYYYIYEETDQLVRTLDIERLRNDEFERYSPDLRLIFNNRPVSFDCLAFESFDGTGDMVFLPAALCNPGYRSRREAEREIVSRSRLFRYATNSGTASGLSPEDAWLHGLFEAIERDAIGLVLLRSIVSPRPEPVRRIDTTTLPRELRELLHLLEAGDSTRLVELWDITSDTAVPTILCGLTVETESGLFRYFGSGTSLSAPYATERAMLEALQGAHIHRDLHEFEQGPLAPHEIDQMSLYRRCEMDAGYFEYRGGETAIHFSDVVSHDLPGIPEQIALLVARLTALECRPYRRTIHRSGTLSVEQVIVPRFERFYLVARGISIAPSWRGRSVLGPGA